MPFLIASPLWALAPLHPVNFPPPHCVTLLLACLFHSTNHTHTLSLSLSAVIPWLAVKQATWTREDGSKVEVAVKCINKKLVRSKPEVVLDEMNVLRDLHNKHIVKIYDWFE